MSPKILFLVGFSALFLLCSCKKEPAKKSTFKESIDISYSNHVLNKLDVKIPETVSSNDPFVIWIHGGAWAMGDKKDDSSIQQFLFDNNIASANINYRLTNDSIPEVDYVEIFNDVDNAIKYVEDNLDKWNLKNNGIVLAGMSAGAHLALHRGYHNENIKGIVPFAGVTYLDNQPTIEMFSRSAELLNFVNKFCDTNYLKGDTIPNNFYKVSPIHFIKKDIPILLFHGNNDHTVHYSQATMFVDSLKAKNVKHKLITLDSLDHNLFDDKKIKNNMMQQFVNFVKSINQK